MESLYTPAGMEANVNAPFPSETTFAGWVVAWLVRVQTAPATTAPVVSVTVPCTELETVWLNASPHATTRKTTRRTFIAHPSLKCGPILLPVLYGVKEKRDLDYRIRHESYKLPARTSERE